jgi:hypothetical protein
LLINRPFAHSDRFSGHKGAGDPQGRAQGRPGARCTRGLACKGSKKDAHEHTGSAEAVRPSLRNGFTAYFVLSLAIGFFVTIIRVMRSIIANLTPASGRQNHTTSPSASAPFVDSASTSTASHPNVRDDGQRPLVRDETAANKPVIWVKMEVEYFSRRGWTGNQ